MNRCLSVGKQLDFLSGRHAPTLSRNSCSEIRGCFAGKFVVSGVTKLYLWELFKHYIHCQCTQVLERNLNGISPSTKSGLQNVDIGLSNFLL